MSLWPQKRKPSATPYGVRALANYFIGLGLQVQNPLDPMRVQKLLFIAHGRSLCDWGTPLVDEPVEAWQWGPVFRSLYPDLKLFGKKPIPQPIYSSAGDDFWIPTVDPDDGHTVDLLHRVWTAFGSKSAIQLSRAMHLRGSPWFETRRREGIKDGEPSNIEIDPVLIIEYFKNNFKC